MKNLALGVYVLRVSTIAILAGCGALPYGQPQAPRVLLDDSARAAGDGAIRHVVIIIQENRSVDNLFYGYPKADVRSYGYKENGAKVELKPVGLDATWDLEHDARAFVTACNGRGRIIGTHCRMNGFDKIFYGCGGSGEPRCPNANPPYSYVPHEQTKPYFAMAHQYVLGDQMYASDFDLSSFVSHQYIIAAQAGRTIDYPSGPPGCEGGPSDVIDTINQKRQTDGVVSPCFDYTTLAAELDAAKLSWRYYASPIDSGGGSWSAYQAVKYIYNGRDWTKDVISPQTQFFSDVTAGKLPVVSWITPTCANSDHAGCGSKTGPSWVAALVNAVGESKYWDSTAIFVFWDEAGGWYDHAPPPYVDYDGLGMRVPLLVISAYAKRNHVSHVRYEHGSILKFIERRFGLAVMSASDRRANSPEKDCFDFSRGPRKFTRIPSQYGEDYFLHQPADPRPLDTE